MEHCRIYVCKDYFGGFPSECLSFKDHDEYYKWLESPLYDKMGYTYQPICSKYYWSSFDKCILAMRNGLKMPHIKRM